MVTMWQLQDGRFIITTSNRTCNPSHALTERNTRGAAMRDTGQLSQLRPPFQKARVVFQSKEVHSQWTRVKNSLRDRLLPDLAAKLHFQQQRLRRLRWQNWKGSSLTEAPTHPNAGSSSPTVGTGGRPHTGRFRSRGAEKPGLCRPSGYPADSQTPSCKTRCRAGG